VRRTGLRSEIKRVMELARSRQSVLAGPQVLILLLGVVTGILVGRSLGPARRGDLLVVVLWTQIGTWTGTMSTTIWATRTSAREEYSVPVVVGAALRACSAYGFAAATVVSLVSAALVDVEHRVLALSCVFISVVSSIFTDIALAAMLGARRDALFSATQVLSTLLYGIFVVALSLAGEATFLTVVVAFGVANIIQTAALVCYTGPPSLSSRKIGAEALKFSRPAHGSTVLRTISGRLDGLLVTLLMGSREAGLFGAAASVAVGSQALTSGFSLVALQEGASMSLREMLDHARVLARQAQFVAAFALVAGGPLAFVGIPIAYGRSYRDSAALSLVLLASAIPQAGSAVWTRCLAGAGYAAYASWAQLAGLGVGLVGSLVLAGRAGLVGVCLACAVGHLVTLLAMHHKSPELVSSNEPVMGSTQ
jgi:O-antigen/teichoic acid export membrane protein